MKQYLNHGILVAALSTILSLIMETAGAQPRTTSDSFSGHYEALSRQVARTGFEPVQMVFNDFWQSLDVRELPSKEQVKQWQERTQGLRATNPCESIQQSSLSHYLNVIAKRISLTERLAQFEQHAKRPEYQGRFSDLPDGREWYQHWIDSWLMSKVDIDELNQIAQQELETANQLLNVARHQEKEAAETPQIFQRREHDDIVAAFRLREDRVSSQLASVLGLSESVKQVSIEPSGLPESFPAPGIYNQVTGTFLYHIQGGVMQENSMDWLFLHEALPGHHLQAQLSRSSPLCPAPKYMPAPLVSAEGWAGYVELLGDELGLYQHPASRTYAAKWRVLRALRVLIDTGLHARGWTDSDAEGLWQQYLPEEPDIMRREIARIKRWPVQVITYVYGKHLIESAISQQLADHPETHLSQLRNTILRLSNQTPIALQSISDFIDRKE